MKRFSSSDSLGTMLYSSPEEEEKAKEGLVYSSEFHAMLDSLDDEGCIEESGHGTGKKRRLGINQVQALEKIFEIDNKLDPERKVKLARELGLQPRQVAIWFQNRRARWKTKQLERDYNLLKAEYESLQLNYSNLDQEKQRLLAELKALKQKLGEENTEWNKANGKAADLKDGSSDSDSSGILNEHNNNLNYHPKLSNPSCSPKSDPSGLCLSSSSMYYPHYQFVSSRAQTMRGNQQQHGAKMEELNLFSLEEACNNIFSVDQPPNLSWY